jgi:uncharacterized protein DUF4038/collagenase-like protein with putative collagen-binding domain
MIRAAPLALLAAALGGCGAGCTSGRVSPKGASATIVTTIAPTDVSVGVGGTVAFTGAVTGTSNRAMLWSVAEPGCGSVSSMGIFTAPAAPAVCHVVVASAADSRRTATATVTVTGPTPPFAVSPDPATVPVNGTQQFTVSPSAAVTWSVVQTTATAAPAFPLALSSNGRYVVDASGHPWRVQADAAWFISALATPAQVDTYLATRKAQGFNAFYFMAMVHPGGYTSVPNAPNNYAGVAPFTTPGNFLTPNEPYWQWIDSVVDKAAAQGMVVMFAYNYLGYPGLQQGWENEVSAMSQADATTWGTWLGNRYKAKTNIIWFALGDQTPASGSTREQNCLATIAAIKATGASQLFMAEPMGGNSNPIMDAPAFASALDLNSYYGYGPTNHGDCYPQADRAYRGVAPPKPVWVQEGGYEFENNTGGFTGQSYETRRTRFWSVLAGGTAGDGFGSRDAYQWISFPNGLATPGATFSKVAFELFATLPWWDFLPSGTGTGFAGRTLVTAGGGTNGGLDWVTSAVTSTGSHLLAYIPTTGGTTARTITIDMTAMKGPAQASWWDPATGARTAIGTLPNTGAQAFTSPGTNAGGQNDWVLLLDAAGMGPCGSISATGLYTAPAAVPIGGACRIRAALQSDPTAVAYASVIVQ